MANRKNESDWTPEAIQRLWNWYGTNPNLDNTYFSAQLGEGIVNFLNATGKLKGKVLDYGCGKGHLLRHLLNRGLECYGVDFSKESIRVLNEKFENHHNWRQGTIINNFVTPYPADFFDVVCCIETLEHLPGNFIAPMLAEIKRIVKPGGIIIITTPYAENLEQNIVYCPFCQSEFHKVQHLRSFTIDHIKSLLISAGFLVIFCKNIDFQTFFYKHNYELPRSRDISINKFCSWLLFKKRKLLDRLFPLEFPHGREFKYRSMDGAGQHLCALVTKDNNRNV